MVRGQALPLGVVQRSVGARGQPHQQFALGMKGAAATCKDIQKGCIKFPWASWLICNKQAK